MQFDGIYTPIITPFKADGSIDREGYVAVIEAQIAGGADGIVIGGTTGENYALTREERVGQFKFGHEVIAGRVPWLGGINDIRTEDVCGYAVAAREHGAAGLLMGSPPYSVPTEKELALHALKVDREAGLPIMLYNYPGRSAVSMGREFLERVARSAHFAAIKESSGDLDRIHMLAREFPHLQLVCGADDQALEFLVWGSRGWVCAAANFFLPECILLMKVCRDDQDFARGRRIMKAMLPVMTVLERGGKFVQCVKYGCELNGLPGGPVRLPLRPMKKELKRQMRDALQTARTTIRKIAEE
jgi:4-hydroxy-tetrahydrodipicolinate synthase